MNRALKNILAVNEDLLMLMRAGIFVGEVVVAVVGVMIAVTAGVMF